MFQKPSWTLSNGKVLNKECKLKKPLACWPARKLKKMGKILSPFLLKGSKCVWMFFSIPQKKILLVQNLFFPFNSWHTENSFQDVFYKHETDPPELLSTHNSYIYLIHTQFLNFNTSPTMIFNTTLLQSVGMMTTKGRPLSVNNHRNIKVKLSKKIKIMLKN